MKAFQLHAIGAVRVDEVPIPPAAVAIPVSPGTLPCAGTMIILVHAGIYETSVAAYQHIGVKELCAMPPTQHIALPIGSCIKKTARCGRYALDSMQGYSVQVSLASGLNANLGL